MSQKRAPQPRPSSSPALPAHPPAVPASGEERLADRFRAALLRVLLVLGLLVAAEQEALAYTDPGTGALIWQMLAVGFVGLLFYARKFTAWFKRINKKDAKE